MIPIFLRYPRYWRLHIEETPTPAQVLTGAICLFLALIAVGIILSIVKENKR